MAYGFRLTMRSTMIRGLRRMIWGGLVVCIVHGIGGGCSSSATPVVAPTGGGQGESCQSRRDCLPALACVSQVCVRDNGGLLDGGQLGLPGESCLTRADCAPGLACIENVCV